MSEIKLCAFCHGEPELCCSELIDDKEAYWVRCSKCDIEQRYFYDKDYAIEKWNKRVENP